MADLLTRSGAYISQCRQYRYWLERKWDTGFKPQVFVMLNPSTADAREDDPTIRRCMGFAKREGAGGIIVVNLFAYRTTDPKELEVAEDAVGPANQQAIGDALLTATLTECPVICAWGANRRAEEQAVKLKSRALDFGAKLVCLGITAGGAPRHPLYVKGNAPLISYH